MYLDNTQKFGTRIHGTRIKKQYTLNFTVEHKKKNAMILSVKVDRFLSKDGI